MDSLTERSFPTIQDKDHRGSNMKFHDKNLYSLGDGVAYADKIRQCQDSLEPLSFDDIHMFDSGSSLPDDGSSFVIEEGDVVVDKNGNMPMVLL